jgi:hypothetical protein
MEDPENLIKYVGYFVMFTIIVGVGITVLAQIAPTSTNESTSAFNETSIFSSIGQYAGLVGTCIVIFAGVLVIKALGLI